MKDINVTAQGRMFAILRHYGLQPYKARRGTKAFRGQLQCERRPVAVQLEITDWDFIRYPRITLLDRPDSLPPLLAHVNAEGNLCYFASGSIILDRYRPDDAVQQCLDAAIRVLDDIMSGTSQTVAIANEFSAYWTFGHRNVAGFSSRAVIPVTVDDSRQRLLGIQILAIASRVVCGADRALPRKKSVMILRVG